MKQLRNCIGAGIQLLPPMVFKPKVVEEVVQPIQTKIEYVYVDVIKEVEKPFIPVKKNWFYYLTFKKYTINKIV